MEEELLTQQDEEVLSALRKMAEANQRLQLMNVFRGIPIINDSQINIVSQGFVLLTVHPYQAVCMTLEKHTFIKCEYFTQLMQATPVAVDVPHAEVVLSHFTPTSDTVGKRMGVRVQSKELVRVEIFSEGGSVVANMADLSTCGVGVYTFGAYTDEQIELRRGREVDLVLHLPDSDDVYLHGKIINVKRERDSMLRRLGIQTFPTPDTETPLLKYIGEREQEIMQELEMTYHVMLKAKRKQVARARQ